ncbi:XPG domain containing-domain-containing protein [Paraphoma chrysanthemicola]|nr:XPG domain containing-domain-containing protein [Paraphoma chrysanthemicola]
MGISGLARRLEPYATRYSAQELEGYSAIVDGPSLAYEGHKLALSSGSSPSKIPSYTDINSVAIGWLESLEKQGIKVLDVLFDGALPSTKQAERLSRTEQNNRRVQQLRASYPTAACPIPTYLGSASCSLLAPTLRESLAQSSFASRTRIVPGEADDFCGLRAKDIPRSVIFTSDTDLVLFDYHPETLIVLFKDADSLAGLKAYSPYHIAKKLQLKSLVPLAWAIQQRLSEGQNELVQDARSLDLESPPYLDFSQRYIAQLSSVSFSNSGLLELPLQSLDVRISEFVHEALHDNPCINVYLPLLVEDPNLASAWSIAQDVRVFAYSLVAPPTSDFQEYRRKAQGISPHKIDTYAASNLEVPAKDLEARMSALHSWADSKSISPTLLWTLFALGLVIAELNTPPPPPIVSRVINGDFDNTWVFLHLAARLQAAMYSLRLLKQVVAVRLARTQADIPGLVEQLSKIAQHMSTFPSIADMFSVPGQAKRVLADHGTMEDYLKEIYTSAGVEMPAEQISNKKRKKQAREAERKQKKADQRQQHKSISANAFEALV